MNITEEQQPSGQHKFVTPVSMPCTQEQFKRDLKGPLESIGCMLSTITRLHPDKNSSHIKLDSGTYWFTSGCGFLGKELESYNPEHFLALASMTDNPISITGEYMVDENGDIFPKPESHPFVFGCRKATVEEINRHFEGNKYLFDSRGEVTKWRYCDEVSVSEQQPKEVLEMAKPDQLYRLKEEVKKYWDGGLRDGHSYTLKEWGQIGWNKEALEKVEPEKKCIAENLIIDWEIEQSFYKMQIINVRINFTVTNQPGFTKLRKNIEHLLNGEYDQIECFKNINNDSRR